MQRSNDLNSDIEILETGLDAISHIIKNQRSLNLRLYIEESYADLQRACRLAGVVFEPIELELDRLNFDAQFHLEVFKLMRLLKNPQASHLEILNGYYNLRNYLFKAHYYFKPLNKYDFVIYDELNKSATNTIDEFTDYLHSLILKNDLLNIKKGLLKAISQVERHATSSKVQQ